MPRRPSVYNRQSRTGRIPREPDIMPLVYVDDFGPVTEKQLKYLTERQAKNAVTQALSSDLSQIELRAIAHYLNCDHKVAKYDPVLGNYCENCGVKLPIPKDAP